MLKIKSAVIHVISHTNMLHTNRFSLGKHRRKRNGDLARQRIIHWELKKKLL